MATGEEAEAEARAARRKEIEANVAEAKRKQAAQAVEAAAASAAATGGFTPLSKQQVVEKLNSVPVFTVTTLEKQLVPVPDEGGSTCCRWYADVDEAQSALVLAQHLNPNPNPNPNPSPNPSPKPSSSPNLTRCSRSISTLTHPWCLASRHWAPPSRWCTAGRKARTSPPTRSDCSLPRACSQALPRRLGLGLGFGLRVGDRARVRARVRARARVRIRVRVS